MVFCIMLCVFRAFRAALLCTLVVLLGGACGRIGFDSEASNDAALVDAANLIDAILGPDAKDGDAAIPANLLSCAEAAAAKSVAVYDFDSDPDDAVDDVIGTLDGSLVGQTQYVAGPSAGCGLALQFPGTTADYAFIEDSALFQLPIGSIDMWFRVTSLPTDFATLASRDASGTNTPGQFSVFVGDDLRVGVRIQPMNAPNNGVGTVCSAAAEIVLGTWNHVGVNFGAPGVELWVNGAIVDEAGTLSFLDCQTGNALGIDGNSNPWVLGAGATFSTEGQATPTDHPYDGAIDHFRISSVRRQFSGASYKPPAL